MVAKDVVIMLPSKTTTWRSCRDASNGPCGIRVTVRRLRGRYERGSREERRGENKRVRSRGEGGVVKFSAEEQWNKEG